MSAAELLEVTGDYLGKLVDDDLRALVVRLCEAELRRCGLPVSAITAGGAQDAPDGGIDVRIRLSAVSAGLDFIPRGSTGFQVKATTMPSAEIKAEMRPKGNLRSSIAELGVEHGAYVIISSKDSTADGVLRDRLKSMNAALTDLPTGSVVHVDFYDRERLAMWVRNYPGVALWVRERIGEPLTGWRPYGNWAPGDPPGSEFLLDDIGRIYEKRDANPATVANGIKAIRAILSKPKGVVRLIGLSGLGKTRLVQALFDNRVGMDALDTSIVIYTDQGADPEPSVRDMIGRLCTMEGRVVVVVDNCNPATHRALTQMVKGSESCVSLITIEYDVADDEPEDTEVFQLAPASDAVLVRILERLVPNVSHADRSRIADFSGGNARVALAIAKTIRGNESLGTLNDAELFKRLFYQNQETDISLLRAAEVCSLVYSFEGVSEAGDGAELPLLAALAEMTVRELYRRVGELRARDLIQQRSKWRAVLPHAIANRLAKQALGRIPPTAVVAAFQDHERLLKSFGRRVGYLHDSAEAIGIARTWFEDPNWLANAGSLSELGMVLFVSVAPLCPALALQSIERAANDGDASSFLASDAPRRQKWIWLLRALAYEPELFDRAALLLARFFTAEGTRKDQDYGHSNFAELFHVVLSGTHALVDQRIGVVRKLLEHANLRLRDCGLIALDAMFQSGHFSSSYDFGFGARSRNFGWHPRTPAELTAWYRAPLLILRELHARGSPDDEKVKTMLARHFRGLWMHADVHAELVALSRDIAASGGWPQGWIAVRMTIKYGEKKLTPEAAKQLNQIEAELRPQDLMQKLEAYVLAEAHGHIDIAVADAKDQSGAGIMAAWEQAHKIAEDIGRQFALQEELLAEALPRVLNAGHGRQWNFGRGLALEVEDVAAMWNAICAAFAGLDPKSRNISLIQGYLSGTVERDRAAASRFLDEALESPVLESQFPLLQAAIQIDAVGAARLSRAVSRGAAKAWTFRQLAYGRTADQIEPAAFKKLVLEIAKLPDGFPVAIDLLGMRLHILSTDKLTIDPETQSLGRELLISWSFTDYQDGNVDYHVSEVVRKCLAGSEGKSAAREFSENFVRALSSEGGDAWRFDHLANALFEIQPEIALDTFLGAKDRYGLPVLSRLAMLNDGIGPVNRVPSELLLGWASKDTSARFPWVAGEIRLLDKGPEHGDLQWTSSAIYLLENANERSAVLAAFSDHFEPRSWSGSLADVLTPYLQPIRALLTHSDPTVRDWARKWEGYLVERIAKERQQEQRIDASFE